MNDLIDKILDEVRSAWRFRWLGLVAAVAVALAGWAIVLSMPDRYEGAASVFVDTRTALKPVLQGLIVEDDVMSQLGYVRQSILSGQSLENIAIKSGVLAAGEPDPLRKATILGDLSSKVVIKAEQARADAYVSSGTIYAITYPNTNPETAVSVTRTVMETFIEETLGGKQESSEATQKFLADQIMSNEDRLRAQESILAEFKKKNLGLMPTERGDYFSQLQGEMDAARQAQNDLDVAMAERAELTRQLRGESVISSSTIASSQSGTGGADTATRIRETQARLDEARLRFTDRHPDVIQLINQLADLNARREAELNSLRRGDAGAAAVSGLSSNPIYQTIQLQLNQVDVKIAALRGKIAQHHAKTADLRKMADLAPKVDAEYAQLNRDYDIIKANQSGLIAQLEKARLGEQADNAGGVRFQIVQAPTAKMASASAHRGLLLLAVLGAALVACAAVAYVLHMLRPVVTSVRDLAGMTQLQVLGVVSTAFPTRLQAEARWAGVRFGLAASLLVVGCVAVMLLNRGGFRLTSLLAGAG